ncbi:hypothetical protein [uncultured Phycicoccus sp.]|uniref:hypothetical protein n=1 Tax=uncultured Phycicoccus sp. TaxID=661422 RepID=UPI0026228546|nr:hypothetical protein [uncultured Phycicoccus sp.]
MPVVTHPGPSAPPAPAVRLEIPDGWQPQPSGDALLRAAGSGAGGDAVEIAVRHLTGDPALGSAVLVEDSTSQVAGGAGQVEEPFVVEIGGREWHARNVSWDEDGTPVVEVHLATTLDPTDVVSRHVLAVGRARGAGLDADYDALQAVLESLVVEEVRG